MSNTSRRRRSLVAGGATLVLAASALVAVGPPAAVAAPGPVVQPAAAVTADRLPTVQINGVVWSQVVVGNTVYAGGSFTNARPAGAAPGTNLTTRNNLLAYDITTGNLVTSFVPDLNGQVLSVAASPDGSRIYVAGDFTAANGQARRRVAAYSTATGLLLPWNPSGPNSQARAVIATNDTVYVGGGFLGLGNGTLRNNLVAYRASDAGTQPWNPNADYTVWALGVSGDGASVFAGGSFQNVGGQAAYGLAKINATSGALDTSWRPSVRNAGEDAGISSLRVQGSFVYGTSWHFGPGGNLEGTFKSPVDGTVDATDVEWVTDCHGDTYSSFMTNGIVYVAGHAHYCGNMGGGFPQYSQWKFQHAQAWTDVVDPANNDILNDVHGYPNWHLGTAPAGIEPGPSMVNWLPDMSMGTYTGQSQAGWNVTGNASYVVFGGEFPTVNGVGQQGLVRFAVRPIAPAKEGPRFVGGSIVPRLVPVASNAVKVTWPAGYDRDSRVLTYRVIRDGAFGSPVHTTTAASNWWTLPLMGFVDTNVPAGSHSYQVVINDSDGNQVFGGSASVGIPASAPGTNAYAQSVRANGARIYWPLNETSGTTVNDRAASASSAAGIGVSDGRADTGVTWNQAGAIVGGDSAAALTDNDWSRVFVGNCAATAGCQWGTETAPDTFTTQLWFRTSGGLAANKRGGRLLGFGDLQNGNSGHRDRHLYMDGSGRIIFGVRAQNNQTRTVVSPASYNNNQWHQVTATMSSAGMRLYVDGVLVGSRADTTAGETYLGYWRLGGDNLGGWPSAPPTRNFIGSVDEVAIYPTALSAAQVLAQYQLGTTGGGGGNLLPTASFTSSSAGLTASFNGSGSSDPDGSISSYAWNFGDGSTGTGATPSRTYGASGTYTVTLTVTDNGGATASTSSPVTVTAPTPGLIASDAFERSVSGGWGTADTGGAWTHTSAGSFSVSGGTGNLSMAAGSGPSAYLNGVSAQDVDLLSALRYDKPATATIYSSMVARRIGTSDYRVKVRSASGSTSLDLVRTVSGTETVLASTVVPGFVMTPADTINLRFQAVGSGTTTLRAKVWLNGAAEPAAWTLTTTDTTAALQAPGAVGFYSYLPGSATNAPIVLSIPSFTVTAP